VLELKKDVWTTASPCLAFVYQGRSYGDPRLLFAWFEILCRRRPKMQVILFEGSNQNTNYCCKYSLPPVIHFAASVYVDNGMGRLRIHTSILLLIFLNTKNNSINYSWNARINTPSSSFSENHILRTCDNSAQNFFKKDVCCFPRRRHIGIVVCVSVTSLRNKQHCSLAPLYYLA
jgi:hypothetical protein